MEQIRDLAIVLRSIPYEERHRIVTALTEQHGRISALARNSIQSRRFGGTLEPFAASQWRFVERPGAELYRVDEATIRRSFDGLRKDFERLALASLLNEIILKLAPEKEACPELFRLHSNALAAIEDQEGPITHSSNYAISLLNGYLAKILQWSGNQPQVGKCMGCQLSLDSLEPHDTVSCIVSDAGWLCPSCRHMDLSSSRHLAQQAMQDFQQRYLQVTTAALRDFYISLSVPIRSVPAQTFASCQEQVDLFHFLEALLIYHVPGFDRTPLKSLRFLNLGDDSFTTHRQRQQYQQPLESSC